MNQKEAKALLEDNFNKLTKMSVPEYTLYRKWVEINSKYEKSSDITNMLFGGEDTDLLPSFEKSIKNNLWMPKNYEDYKDLKPKVIFADDKSKQKIWTALRIFCHRMVWNQSPGRLLKFYVVDEVTEKYLGFFSLGSDFIGAGGRDAYIGWTQDQKLKKGMLNHTAMGSTIAATQPLGYNYLGGKLISLMVCSDVVENAWNNRYKENLAGITTTSLYGGFSQYNRLSYWRKCKTTEGKISLEPSDDVYKKLKKWLKENKPEEHEKAITAGSHPKTRMLSSIYKALGVKPPINNAPRGTYFCSLYDNTLNFLSMKDDKLGKKKFDNSVDTLSELWKNKYASKRITNLINNNNTKDECLFYDKLIGIEWEEAKKLYLED